MTFEDKISCGIAGTILSATGAGISVTEIQAIVSIVFTILGFVIGVIMPTCLKIYNKYKEAKKDGVITEEEKKDLINSAKEGIEEIKKGAEDVKDKVNKK